MKRITRSGFGVLSSTGVAIVMAHAALLALASGQNVPGQKANLPLFVESPGELEFTGRLLVRPRGMSDDTGVPGASAIRSAMARASLAQNGLQIVRYIPETDEYLVQVVSPEAMTALKAGARGQDENVRAREMLSTGGFEYVEPDWKCWPVATPNDTYVNSMWHLNAMKMPQAWDITTGLSTLIVSTVDSGVDKTHPDLAPKLLPGYVSTERRTEAQGATVQDVNGHGTNTLGCAGAIGNNAKGVTGMGWNYQLLPVRCSDNEDGTASQSAILDGARWAADNGARVVSASFTGVSSTAVNSTGTYIKSKSGLFLYAAGNDAVNWTNFSWPDTIVVGATSSGDFRAGFSGYGNGVSVFAPGVNILTTFDGGGYGYNSGTSFATPIANGVIGLIWSVNPGLTPDQVQQILYSTCDRLGNMTLTYPAKDPVFSYGRINAFKAVQAAQASIGAPTATPDTSAVFDPNTKNLDVLANDIDGSMLGLTITAFDSTTTLGGTVTRLVGAGPSGRDLLKYTPPATIPSGTPFPPLDTFQYTIKNSVQATASTTATVSIFEMTDLKPALNPPSLAAKIRASYFDLSALTPLGALPDFANGALVTTRLDQGVVANVGSGSLGGLGLLSNSGVVFRGFVNVATDDIFKFYLKSDDGSRLYVDDQLVLDNDGVHAVFEASGFLPLKAGQHKLLIEYFQADDATANLVLSYESFGALGGTAITKRNIPANMLKHSDCPADINYDGVVDDADFTQFAAAYDLFSSYTGDLDFDAKVDDLDFVIFATAYDNLICP